MLVYLQLAEIETMKDGIGFKVTSNEGKHVRLKGKLKEWYGIIVNNRFFLNTRNWLSIDWNFEFASIMFLSDM